MSFPFGPPTRGDHIGCAVCIFLFLFGVVSFVVWIINLLSHVRINIV